MKNKNIFISAIFLTNSLNLYSQVAVLTLGENVVSTNGSISYSVGEVFYTNKGSGSSQSEGIQHAYTIHPVNNGSTLHVSMYPNPTSDLLFFKVENLNYSELSFKIFNVSGTLLRSGPIQDPSSSVSLNNLPSGTYLIKINRGYTEEKSYKIFKIN